jgi:hypothetical protein
MTRTGKIARLPHQLRNQVNHRLRDGEPGPQLLLWLNALPEVRSILQRDFDSRDITEQNLSDWKQGGYQEWLLQQDSFGQFAELSATAGDLAGSAPGRVSDQLAAILAARFATDFAAWDGADGEALRGKVRVLRGLCREVAELRRGDHAAARLQIGQARLARDREKTEEEAIDFFRRWLDFPKVRETVPPDSPALDKTLDPFRSAFGVDRLPPNPTIKDPQSP